MLIVFLLLFAAFILSVRPLLAVEQSSPGGTDPEPRMGEDHDLEPASGEEALAWLLAGNRRFVEGRARHDHESLRRVAMLDRKGQRPFAVVLGCSDSRVPPELLLDHGLGDLFVIRVAGNVVADDEIGSIEFAALHLGVKIVLVLGHQSCGAVTAAQRAIDGEPSELQTLIRRIQPALAMVPPGLPAEERLRRGIEENTRQSVKKLQEILDRVQPSDQLRPLVVGAHYDTKTGAIRLLDR